MVDFSTRPEPEPVRWGLSSKLDRGYRTGPAKWPYPYSIVVHGDGSVETVPLKNGLGHDVSVNAPGA